MLGYQFFKTPKRNVLGQILTNIYFLDFRFNGLKNWSTMFD